MLLRRIGLALVCVLFAVTAVHATSTPSSESSPNPKQVRYISFHGAKAIKPREIKKIMTTREKSWYRFFSKAPLDNDVLAEDLDRITRFYRSEGFYHASILSHNIVPLRGNDVRVEISIDEGEPMLISELKLTVDGEPQSSWTQEILKILPLHPSERFTIPGYQEIEKAVLRYMADWGYPKARTETRARLDKRLNKGEVFVDVTKGPVCYFGSIRIEGNESVSDDVIRRELEFTTGQRFSGSRVRSSQQKLFGLDLFKFVDLTVENMEGEETTLPVRVLVRESKKQTVRIGVGYGTEDELRGQIQWEIRNFLGDGRRLLVNAKASSIVQQLETRFIQPYLFGPPSTLTVDLGVIHENQESFENRKIYLKPLFNYKWNDRLTSFAGYNLEANRLSNVTVDEAFMRADSDENEEYFVSSIVIGNLWERVDNTLNPKEGFRLIQNLEWASVGLGSEVDYVKLTLEGRKYWPLGVYGTLAGKLKWGGIATLENTEVIPIFKRFFAGGSESVRGYPYQKLGPLDEYGNPLGGMSLVEGSAEWRFPLRKSFEGVLFFDFGNVYSHSYEFLWDSLAYTAGCGVRYLTIVGPLRLDFGYELNPPEQEHFTPYQVHFSIGQAF